MEIARQTTPVNYEVQMIGKKKIQVVQVASLKPFNKASLHAELESSQETHPSDAQIPAQMTTKPKKSRR